MSLGHRGVSNRVPQTNENVPKLQPDEDTKLHYGQSLAVHAAIDAIDHATRAVTELQRTNEMRVDLNLDRGASEAELENALAMILSSCDTSNVAARATEHQSAEIAKLRNVAVLASTLHNYEWTTATLNNLRAPVQSLRKLLANESIKRFDRAADTVAGYLLDDLVLDTLARLEEARLTANNSAYGFRSSSYANTDQADLSLVIIDAQQEIANYARSRHIQLENKLAAARVIVPCSSDLVRRMFVNLIHNAVKYSDTMQPPERAWIEVKARRQPTSIGIAIESWGPAVEANEISAVFESGVRGKHSSRGGRTGAGLGLALAQWVCDIHGWRISLESVPAVSVKRNPSKDRFVTTVRVAVPLDTHS